MPSERYLRILITVAALLLALIHFFAPHLSIDGITLTLLLLAIAPWLAPIIKSIELPGGFKLELQELKQEIAEVRGAAQSAENKATYAIAQSESETSSLKDINPDQEFHTLAQLYNEVRATQKSSNARTFQMTEIVQKMVTLAPDLKQFDIEEALRNITNAGKRLSGYAYLFAKPDFTKLSTLVYSATYIETQPFGQYWSLQAIDRLLFNKPSGIQVEDEILESLQILQSRFQLGTDRHYELERILQAYFT